MPLIGISSSSFYASLRSPQIISPPAPPPPPPPLEQFTNGNFEDGFNNWEVINQAVSPGGINPNAITQLGGCPIPADPTPFPIGLYGPVFGVSSGQATSFSLVPNFGSPSIFESNVLPSGPNGKYAELKINYTQVNRGGTTLYGPALVSKNPVIAAVGDRIEFQWRATGNGDAYNVFAYIIDPNQACRSFIMLDDTGNSSTAATAWAPAYKVIGPGDAGNYFFVFLCGGFDFDFGAVLGATLEVDEVKIQKAGTY
jgi:hypothetical protein